MTTIGTRRTWTKILAAGAALVLLTAMPAGAEIGVDQALEPDGGPTSWTCGGCTFGQTFVPSAVTITGVDLVITSTTTSSRFDTLEVSIHADGPEGALLGQVSEARTIAPATGANGWQQFTFAEPIEVTPGQTYYLGFQAIARKVVPLTTPSNVDRYAPGTMYLLGGPTGGDLFFRTHGELAASAGSNDVDGDGIDDADDHCPGTDLGAPAPATWNNNRFWNDGAGTFVDGKGKSSGITLADTGGCDGRQIIEAAGLGAGHAKQGLSGGELRDWVGTVRNA